MAKELFFPLKFESFQRKYDLTHFNIVVLEKIFWFSKGTLQFLTKLFDLRLNFSIFCSSFFGNLNGKEFKGRLVKINFFQEFAIFCRFYSIFRHFLLIFKTFRRFFNNFCRFLNAFLAIFEHFLSILCHILAIPLQIVMFSL